MIPVLMTFMSCQSHLNRYVTVYDTDRNPVKAEVVFQTSDWNNLLGVLDNGFAVATTNETKPVKVKIPDHKEITVGVRRKVFDQNPAAKIRFKGEGNLEIYKSLTLITNRMATKSRPSGYHILISKDPKKTWRDYQKRGVSN